MRLIDALNATERSTECSIMQRSQLARALGRCRSARHALNGAKWWVGDSAIGMSAILRENI